MSGEGSAAAKALGSAAAVAALAVALPACGVVSRQPDLIAGKQTFIAKCGACHQLNRAGTTGVVGPNLDYAFQASLSAGMKRSTVKGVVRRQIGQPNRRPQLNPQTHKPEAKMPADLVTGNRADDVAAYVAAVTGLSGQDPGRLADVGSKKSNASTSAKNGQVDIPVAKGGALAFQYASATAPAGKLVIKTANDGTTSHNIAIQGPGVSSKGPIVSPGGTSQVSVTLKPGTYTFYCSVPGHREAGMQGKLTVK
jgi:plastocyanin